MVWRSAAIIKAVEYAIAVHPDFLQIEAAERALVLSGNGDLKEKIAEIFSGTFEELSISELTLPMPCCHLIDT